MQNIEKIYSELQDFAFACIAQANQQKELQLDSEQEYITSTPSNINSNSQMPLSYPHLVSVVLKNLRNIIAKTNEKLSKDDTDLIEALEVFVKTFPKWTAQQLGDSIQTKFNDFRETRSLEFSIKDKNQIYFIFGDIAFGAYLKGFDHKNPLIKKFSKKIGISKLINEIEFMLKLIRYDKDDINHISTITVYINDLKPLALPAEYLNKAKLKKDIEKLDVLVNNIKSLSGWTKIRASSLLSDLLNAAKNILETINMQKTQLQQVVEILNEYPISKTASFVFIYDTMYPFMDGLKSEKEILSSISINNDVPNASNINRHKKRAVENILKRK